MRAALVVLCAAASPAAAMRMASPVARARAAARDASYADSRFRDGDYGMPMHRGRAMRPARQSSYPYQVQGDSLRTWSGAGHPSEYSEVWMESDGRPIEADVELWQGPGYTPRKMRVYSQDGQLRPFRTGMHNAGGRAFAVRNRGPIEFPLAANVAGGMPTYNGQPESPYAYDHRQSRQQQHQGQSASRNIQGGASWSFPFDATVDSVEVHIMTEGRDLNAKIEVLQGPNNVMQSIEIEEDDGYLRPFSGVFETLGVGTVIRIVNTGPIEFPISAEIVPHRSMRMYHDRRPSMGGGSDMMSSRGRSAQYYDQRGVARGWWERESMAAPRSSFRPMSSSRWYERY